MPSRKIKLAVVAVIAAGVLVLSPWSAWFGEPDFHYGLPEVRAAIEGTWELTVSLPGGGTRATTFTLAQGRDAEQTHASRALVRSAAACGSRSLVKAAGACVDATFMPLEVRIAGAPMAPTDHGMFAIVGTTFRAGELQVSLDGLFVSAIISPRGTVERDTLSVHQPPGELPATLVRIRS